jgi:hypothetical protein
MVHTTTLPPTRALTLTTACTFTRTPNASQSNSTPSNVQKEARNENDARNGVSGNVSQPNTSRHAQNEGVGVR